MLFSSLKNFHTNDHTVAWASEFMKRLRSTRGRGAPCKEPKSCRSEWVWAKRHQALLMVGISKPGRAGEGWQLVWRWYKNQGVFAEDGRDFSLQRQKWERCCCHRCHIWQLPPIRRKWRGCTWPNLLRRVVMGFCTQHTLVNDHLSFSENTICNKKRLSVRRVVSGLWSSRVPHP